MKDDDVIQNDLPIDGGALTPEEQKAADELAANGDGDNAAVEAAAAKAAADKAAADAAAAGDADKDAAAVAAAEATAAATAAAEAAAKAAPAARAEVPDPKPDAGRDFDADRVALIAKRTALNEGYKTGTIEEDAKDEQLQKIQDDLDALGDERSKYSARLAVWEDRQSRAVASSAQEFNSAALAWEKNNAAFMSNPIRKDAMQRAVAAIDKEQPGLSAVDLLARAEEVAFEAFNYKRSPTEDAAAAAAIAAAKKGRQVDVSKIPPTTRDAPSALGIDPGKSSFAALDEMPISDLEDAIARLPRDKLEEFLADAPGAQTRGT